MSRAGSGGKHSGRPGIGWFAAAIQWVWAFTFVWALVAHAAGAGTLEDGLRGVKPTEGFGFAKLTNDLSIFAVIINSRTGASMLRVTRGAKLGLAVDLLMRADVPQRKITLRCRIWHVFGDGRRSGLLADEICFKGVLGGGGKNELAGKERWFLPDPEAPRGPTALVLQVDEPATGATTTLAVTYFWAGGRR